jgi:hypothetical protein
MNAELQRLAEDKAGRANWRLWGPYLSERQWGTVREDYSADGSAWNYFPHDHARSRAYRWGEDGLAGFSDDKQFLCLSLALWNGKDPILKERLFGLINSEGNHGEDVKELYYYLDATPSQSYLKMLYKYPQSAYPYAQLVEENRKRGVNQPEFELLDSGLFDQDKYFDVFMEYAKRAPDDVLMKITAWNRGGESAAISLLPHLSFRNTWTWSEDGEKPLMFKADSSAPRIELQHPKLGNYYLEYEGEPVPLFTENETNAKKIFGKDASAGTFFKDAFHDYVVEGKESSVNPAQRGTKAGLLYRLEVPAGDSVSISLRLRQADRPAFLTGTEMEKDFSRAKQEADDFYASLQAEMESEDAKSVQRQAYAGLIWSKQYYHFNVQTWLDGDPGQPKPPETRKEGRNSEWLHLVNGEVISMPDKWEYPWYAAWDLAFHCVAFSEIDSEFAKGQLLLLLREWYMHPNGQLPAYEWELGDVNPPVHAWAAFRVFEIDRKKQREIDPNHAGDLKFLARVFQKLLVNFTWWVNRKDHLGRNIFQGGFLGLDNIGCFDRSKPLPMGGLINQADGTSWMAMYCLNLGRISIELAMEDDGYEDIATKFLEHFLAIAGAINGVGDLSLGLWDEEDQFYYDQLSLPDGSRRSISIQSLVGLIPLLAVEVLRPGTLKKLPNFASRLDWYLAHKPELAALISNWKVPGEGDRHLLSLLRGHRMKALLKRMLDETQFLSDFGVRSVSKAHDRKPYQFDPGDPSYTVAYWPGESRSGLFGGNSNWRGPIWMPINFLIVEALQKFYYYYGDDFKVECPSGSGIMLTIQQVAQEISGRLTRLVLKGPDGQRPVLKYHSKMATDPHFKDYVLFHEYFHGETGQGLGASHQTGWTGLLAKLLQPSAPPTKPRTNFAAQPSTKEQPLCT